MKVSILDRYDSYADGRKPNDLDYTLTLLWSFYGAFVSWTRQRVYRRSKMGMLKEFKDFAVKGNAIDMAVGFVIGAAFGKIVTSLVNDIIMPPIGLLLGKVDFSSSGDPPEREDGHQVRRLHQHRPRLRDRGLCHLPGHQADQPAEEGTAAC